MIKNEGIEEKQLEDAKKMLKKGYDFQKISDITGLQIKKITNLKENKS